MTTYTPAGQILREVRELHHFILELVASPDTVRWHWPRYYLLYIDMDRMAWRIKRAGELFARRPASWRLDSLSEGPLPAAEQAEWVNDTFAELGETYASMVHLLWQMSRSTMTVIADQKLRQHMRAHFHPKSEWYQVFQSDYCPGQVSADRQTLERTLLVTDPDPPARIHDLGEKDLYVRQYFDIGTEDARILLAQAIREVEVEHGHASRAMMNFFLTHCSIDKLVHPSSI